MKFDIAPVRWGLLLAMFGLLMGVYLGVHFGKSEDAILAYLKTKAEASAVFAGDPNKIENAVANGWKYLKRSHEHFQGLGAIAIGLCLMIAALPLKCWPKRVLSTGVSLGAVLYPLFWYLVAYRCGDIEKGAAKESLALMAQAGAGIYLLSVVGTLAAVAAFAVWKENPPAVLKGLFKTAE